MGWKMPVRGKVKVGRRGVWNALVGWAGMVLVSAGAVSAGFASEVERGNERAILKPVEKPLQETPKV